MRIHDGAAQMNAQRPAGHALEERETKHQQANSDVRGIRPSLPENWRHADLPLPIRISASASAILHQIRLGSEQKLVEALPRSQSQDLGHPTLVVGSEVGHPPGGTHAKNCKLTHPSSICRRLPAACNPHRKLSLYTPLTSKGWFCMSRRFDGENGVCPCDLILPTV